jgi:hypothetical protein
VTPAGLDGDVAAAGSFGNARQSSSTDATAAAVDGTGSPDAAGQQQQQASQPPQQQRLVVFGGCLDLSGFLSLNKNYVQSKETWLLQLDNLG